MIKRYYAIKIGRVNDKIVRSWSECEELVKGYSGAVFKGFQFELDAQAFLSTPTSLSNKRAQGRAQDIQDVCQSRQSSSKTHSKRDKKETLNERFNRLNSCTERKSYTDPFTGEYYHNRCVKRKHPRVLTGINYQPSDDMSIPWD